MDTTNTVAITGNTYPVKDQIKALGGRWDADGKAWRVPAAQADAARALVAGAAKPRPSCSSGYRPTKCTYCGCAASQYNPVYRNGKCRDCYRSEKEEWDMDN